MVDCLSIAAVVGVVGCVSIDLEHYEGVGGSYRASEECDQLKTPWGVSPWRHRVVVMVC